MTPTTVPVKANWFYINYVVCKFLVLKANWGKSMGFILTMWYVNIAKEFKKKIKEILFYINYVVCK